MHGRLDPRGASFSDDECQPARSFRGRDLRARGDLFPVVRSSWGNGAAGHASLTSQRVLATQAFDLPWGSLASVTQAASVAARRLRGLLRALLAANCDRAG